MRCLLLICLLFLARLSSGQVSNVFPVNISEGGGVIYERSWLIGTYPHSFGLNQYGMYKDTNGYAISISPEYAKTKGIKYYRYTSIIFGSHSFRAPLPMIAVAVIGVFILLLIAWLTVAAFHWISNRRVKNEPDAARTLP
jgi:hypothetical protein